MTQTGHGLWLTIRLGSSPAHASCRREFRHCRGLDCGPDPVRFACAGASVWLPRRAHVPLRPSHLRLDRSRIWPQLGLRSGWGGRVQPVAGHNDDRLGRADVLLPRRWWHNPATAATSAPNASSASDASSATATSPGAATTAAAPCDAAGTRPDNASVAHDPARQAHQDRRLSRQWPASGSPMFAWGGLRRRVTGDDLSVRVREQGQESDR